MKKIQNASIVTLLFLLSTGIVYASSQGMGMQMGKEEQGRMQEGMQDLQKQMNQVHSTQDVAKREKLLEQHMEKMNKMMKKMNEMPMMGREGSTGMQGQGSEMSMEKMSNRQDMMSKRMDMMQMMMGQMMEQNEAMMETERMKKTKGPRK